MDDSTNPLDGSDADPDPDPDPDHDLAAAARAAAEDATRIWLDEAVIGLNLCPFARAAVARRQVRYVVTAATDEAELRIALAAELSLLVATAAERIDTTLIVCPNAPADFDDFNDFLDEVDALLRTMDLEGTVQVASFHPRYRFEGTEEDDVTNATNRSPHPTLQLLREASVERVLAPIADPDAIWRTNLATLEALGPSGWEALSAAWRRSS